MGIWPANMIKDVDITSKDGGNQFGKFESLWWFLERSFESHIHLRLKQESDTFPLYDSYNEIYSKVQNKIFASRLAKRRSQTVSESIFWLLDALSCWLHQPYFLLQTIHPLFLPGKPSKRSPAFIARHRAPEADSCPSSADSRICIPHIMGLWPAQALDRKFVLDRNARYLGNISKWKRPFWG